MPSLYPVRLGIHPTHYSLLKAVTSARTFVSTAFHLAQSLGQQLPEARKSVAAVTSSAMQADMDLLCITARLVARFVALAASIRRQREGPHNSKAQLIGIAASNCKFMVPGAATLDRFFLETPLRLAQALGYLFEQHRLEARKRNPRAAITLLQQQADELMVSPAVVCFVAEHACHMLATLNAPLEMAEIGGGLVAFKFERSDLRRAQVGTPIAHTMLLLARLLPTNGPIRTSWQSASSEHGPMSLSDQERSTAVDAPEDTIPCGQVLNRRRAIALLSAGLHCLVLYGGHQAATYMIDVMKVLRDSYDSIPQGSAESEAASAVVAAAAEAVLLNAVGQGGQFGDDDLRPEAIRLLADVVTGKLKISVAHLMFSDYIHRADQLMHDGEVHTFRPVLIALQTAESHAPRGQRPSYRRWQWSSHPTSARNSTAVRP